MTLPGGGQSHPGSAANSPKRQTALRFQQDPQSPSQCRSLRITSVVARYPEGQLCESSSCAKVRSLWGRRPMRHPRGFRATRVAKSATNSAYACRQPSGCRHFAVKIYEPGSNADGGKQVEEQAGDNIPSPQRYGASSAMFLAISRSQRSPFASSRSLS